MPGLTDDGVRLEPGSMLYPGSGRRELPLRARRISTAARFGLRPLEKYGL
ncbi:hypothetical protein [Kitasatospora sp. NPDC050543]